MKLEDAVRKWVSEFNRIPQRLIERAFENNLEDWVELTEVIVDDYVWSDDYRGSYEIISIDREEGLVVIDVDGEQKEVSLEYARRGFDSWLPMWGTLWTFGESLDEEWARENTVALSECGFRVFEDQETGDIYIGIDGGGYDFYEHHWTPLYEARGLKWHE